MKRTLAADGSERFVLWFDVWITYAGVGAAIGRPRGRGYGCALAPGEYDTWYRRTSDARPYVYMSKIGEGIVRDADPCDGKYEHPGVGCGIPDAPGVLKIVL